MQFIIYKNIKYNQVDKKWKVKIIIDSLIYVGEKNSLQEAYKFASDVEYNYILNGVE